MSIKIMSWVWENGPNSAPARLVLLALADFCNDDGVCWPSMDRIAKKAAMTERGAQKIARRLEAERWLLIVTGGGRKGCNEYRLIRRNPERETPNHVHPERGSPPNGSAETPNGSAENPEPRSPEPSRTIKEPSKTLERVQAQPFEVPSDADVDTAFAAFWKAYPKRVGMVDAQAAFIEVCAGGAKPEAVVAGAQAYAAASTGTEPRYLIEPKNWLRAKRWTDELAPQPPPDEDPDIARYRRIAADYGRTT